MRLSSSLFATIVLLCALACTKAMSSSAPSQSKSQDLVQKFADALNKKSKPAMEEFLKEYRVTFGVLRDAKRKLAAAINVPSLPTSYLIDGQGRVQSIQPGARTVANSKDFIRQIETLLEQNHKLQ